MKRKIEMPRVGECAVTECVYNREEKCFAHAITVGDGAHPRCDTFCQGSQHLNNDMRAGVGACKVASCVHNDDYECQAQSIRVEYCSEHADCTTFEERQ